jgi:hypothetical protein
MNGTSIYGLPRKEAAAYVREKHGQPCTATTLANIAAGPGGPVYRLVCSRAYYLPADLDSWCSSRVSAPMRRAAEAVTETARAGEVAA